MWRARFYQAVPLLLKDYPTARFIYLTLTARNCEVTELRDTLDWMNKSWVKLIQRKQWPAFGWVKSVEVTRNNNPEDLWYGTAHPHFHALLVVKPSYFNRYYLSQEKWRQLWQSCLRVDYDPTVDVRTIKPRPLSGLDGDVGPDLVAAITETLKYSVKDTDLVRDRDWLLEVTKQLHKSRAVAVGGVLKDYLSQEEPEDLIHGDEVDEDDLSEDNLRVWFGWREMYSRYVKQERVS